MAESRPRSRNHTFLQEQEQLRLSKPSNLAIDLRNKVVGECQAYQFGGVTHYLDDRGYLLAKRLMERYNGRYTIGVYELLHKAIKTLIQNETESPETEQEHRAPLFRDANRVQMLALDSVFERNELRIVYATEVKLTAGDLLYHGSTLDISASAIRLSMKRAYTLGIDQEVLVSFPDFKTENGDAFSQLTYRIQDISHSALRTQVVLFRRDRSEQFERWFSQWSQQYKSLAKIDINHQLLNIAHSFYLRLYLKTVKKPLLWLSPVAFPDPIKAIHLNSNSSRAIHYLLDNQGKLNLSLLPLQQVLNADNTAYLVFIRITHDVISSVVLPYLSPDLTYALSDDYEHVLLVQHQSVSFQHYDIQQQCAELFDIDENKAELLENRLKCIEHAIILNDITESCRHLPKLNKDSSLVATLSNQQILSVKQPTPASLNHHIHRRHQRYLIHTDISLYLLNEHLTVTTQDVSENGLSLELTGHFAVSEGTIVRVNFIRWQSKVKKVTLSNIPYTVRSMQYWEGTTTLGLERNIHACGDKVNHFFADTIAENRAELGLDTQDLLTIHESALFGEQIAQHMPNKPFYIGQDKDRKRIIQAVANTANNHADDLTDFWTAFSQYATTFTELIRSSLSNNDPIDDFGVYSYLDNRQQWHIQTDLQFERAEHKALFINRALLATRYAFFHCSLTALKSPSIEQEPDLEQQLSTIRRHSPHHIRTLRDVIRHLSAVGDLTDITTLIETAYRRN